MSNTLYVKPNDEAHQAMLVEHYEFLGYYVKVVDGRVRVSSVKPQKSKVKKNEEKRPNRNADGQSDAVRDSDRSESRGRSSRR